MAWSDWSAGKNNLVQLPIEAILKQSLRNRTWELPLLVAYVFSIKVSVSTLYTQIYCGYISEAQSWLSGLTLTREEGNAPLKYTQWIRFFKMPLLVSFLSLALSSETCKSPSWSAASTPRSSINPPVQRATIFSQQLRSYTFIYALLPKFTTSIASNPCPPSPLFLSLVIIFFIA